MVIYPHGVRAGAPLSAGEPQALSGRIDDYYESPYKVLEYWMGEREEVRLARIAGKPRPWTSDPILRRFRFCNVFRRYDTVTQHYCSWVGSLWGTDKDRALFMFNTLMYRIINWPPTLDAVGLVRRNWGRERGRVEKALKHLSDSGEQMYTGAYMITAEHIPGQPKYISSLRTLDVAWPVILKYIKDSGGPYTGGPYTVEGVTKLMATLPRVGRFIGYEVATDLTYNILSEATDIDSWANAGPGAVRGLNRLNRYPLKHAWSEEDAVVEMGELLDSLRKRWPWRNDLGSEKLHLREVEHSLCEFDKYSRVLLGEGRPRSTYQGGE